MKKKSLIGWVGSNNPIKFDSNHLLAELLIPPIYKSKQGVFFHGHATKNSKYLYNPRKVRITIEEE